MEIRYANKAELNIISQYDKHISKEELLKSLLDGRVIVLIDGNNLAGWIRYNLFWDNTPFLNMIFLQEAYRRKGLGQRLMNFWEKEMKAKDYNLLMTSTLSSENAQHFYRKLNYVDSGSLLLENETLEIIFTKKI